MIFCYFKSNPTQRGYRKGWSKFWYNRLDLQQAKDLLTKLEWPGRKDDFLTSKYEKSEGRYIVMTKLKRTLTGLKQYIVMTTLKRTLTGLKQYIVMTTLKRTLTGLKQYIVMTTLKRTLTGLKQYIVMTTLKRTLTGLKQYIENQNIMEAIITISM